MPLLQNQTNTHTRTHTKQMNNECFLALQQNEKSCSEILESLFSVKFLQRQLQIN